MAYVDSFLKVMASQVCSAGSEVSASSIKLDTLNDAVNTSNTSVRDIGAGEPLNVWVKVVESVTMTAADTGSWQVELISDSTADLATSPVNVQILGTLDSDSCSTTGKLYNFTISPTEIVDGDEYIGIRLTESATIANVTVSAGINMNQEKFKAYPKSANAVIVKTATSA